MLLYYTIKRRELHGELGNHQVHMKCVLQTVGIIYVTSVIWINNITKVVHFELSIGLKNLSWFFMTDVEIYLVKSHMLAQHVKEVNKAYLMLSAQHPIAPGNIDSMLSHKSNQELEVFSHHKCGTVDLLIRAWSWLPPSPGTA